MRKRLTVSGFAVIILFIGLMVLACIPTDTWKKNFQGVVLTFVVVVNIFTTVFQGSVFGVVGKFPPKYMGATMIGQCVGGLIPAIYVILMALKKKDPEKEGFFGFLIATLCFLIRYKLLNLTWYYIV